MAALYAYAVPLHNVFKVIVPFFILLGLASMVQAPAFILTLLLAALFYGILGIKELVIIHRFETYRYIALVMLVAVAWRFFSSFHNWESPWVFTSALAVGFLFFFLMWDLVLLRSSGESVLPIVLVTAVSSMVIWQITVALLLLPFSPPYQVAFLLLVAATLTELVPEYVARLIRRNTILSSLAIFLILIIVIMLTNHWTV